MTTGIIPEIRLIVLGVVILIRITREFGAERYQLDVPSWPTQRGSHGLQDLVVPFFAREILVQLPCETREGVVLWMDVAQAEVRRQHHIVQLKRHRRNTNGAPLGHIPEVVEHALLDCVPRVSGEARQKCAPREIEHFECPFKILGIFRSHKDSHFALLYFPLEHLPTLRVRYIRNVAKAWVGLRRWPPVSDHIQGAVRDVGDEVDVGGGGVALEIGRR